MSIYQTRKRSANECATADSLGGFTTSKGVKAALSGAAGRAAAAAAFNPPNGKGMSLDWSALRKADPANRLLPASREWLETLPSEVRPASLAAKYPRIANILAVEWANPPVCRDYLTALLVDRRGSRKGFPVETHRELSALRDYYFTLHLTLAE